MKLISRLVILVISTFILMLSTALADEQSERKAIEQMLTGFGEHREAVPDLFTSDAPDNERNLLPVHEEPMSEVTTPRIGIRSVRFVVPNVALVDCVKTQYGSVIVARTTPLLLVIRKDRGRWRITSLRELKPESVAP